MVFESESIGRGLLLGLPSLTSFQMDKSALQFDERDSKDLTIRSMCSGEE